MLSGSPVPHTRSAKQRFTFFLFRKTSTQTKRCFCPDAPRSDLGDSRADPADWPWAAVAAPVAPWLPWLCRCRHFPWRKAPRVLHMNCPSALRMKERPGA